MTTTWLNIGNHHLRTEATRVLDDCDQHQIMHILQLQAGTYDDAILHVRDKASVDVEVRPKLVLYSGPRSVTVQ